MVPGNEGRNPCIYLGSYLRLVRIKMMNIIRITSLCCAVVVTLSALNGCDGDKDTGDANLHTSQVSTKTSNNQPVADNQKSTNNEPDDEGEKDYGPLDLNKIIENRIKNWGQLGDMERASMLKYVGRRYSLEPMGATITVNGKVVDQDGKAVSEDRVTVRVYSAVQYSEGGAGGELTYRSRLNAEGEFFIKVDNAYAIEVYYTGGWRTLEPIRFTPDYKKYFQALSESGQFSPDNLEDFKNMPPMPEVTTEVNLQVYSNKYLETIQRQDLEVVTNLQELKQNDVGIKLQKDKQWIAVKDETPDIRITYDSDITPSENTLAVDFAGAMRTVLKDVVLVVEGEGQGVKTYQTTDESYQELFGPISKVKMHYPSLEIKLQAEALIRPNRAVQITPFNHMRVAPEEGYAKRMELTPPGECTFFYYNMQDRYGKGVVYPVRYDDQSGNITIYITLYQNSTGKRGVETRGD